MAKKKIIKKAEEESEKSHGKTAKTHKVKSSPAAKAPLQKEKFTKEGKEIRGIIRVAGKDLVGDIPLKMALSHVKGVGVRLADVTGDIILRELKLPSDAVIGQLDDKEIDALEYIISNPLKYGVPAWMLNRRRDFEEGIDKHLIGTDLTFVVKQDIEKERNLNTWIGYRHAYGQKVRGQRTRTTGRRGMTVGVIRKKILAKAGATAPATGAPVAAKKEEKKGE